MKTNLEEKNMKWLPFLVSGNTKAQNLFFEANTAYLNAFLSKYTDDYHLREECSIEALNTFFNNLDNFIYGNTKITTYLSTMALNRMRDEYRNKIRLKNTALKTYSFKEEYYQFDDNSDLIKSILFEIDKFKPLEKEIFLDFFINQLKISEISQNRNINVNTIKSVIRRGRERLKEKFKV
jgi:RNA polymerase sigma-70 factor (ECF subfamily)